MKTIIFTSILIIFTVLILPGLLSFEIRNVPDRNQPSFDRTQEIYGNLIISQTFTSTDDNLSMIGLSIKNPNLENKRDILFSILDSGGGLLRDSMLNGKSIHDGDFVKFKFLPIKDSKNKIFTFSLSAPSSNQQEALEVFLTKQVSQGVEYLTVEPIKIDQEEAKMSVSFVPFYKVTSPYQLILEIYRDWMKRFFADKYFAIFYILLITVGITLLSKSPLKNWKKRV